MATSKSKPVWKREPPPGVKHAGLSPQKKARAKALAKRAGRPYPNLVDNMRAAKESAPAKKRATTNKRPAKKVAGKVAKKQPRKKTARKNARGQGASRSRAMAR